MTCKGVTKRVDCIITTCYQLEDKFSQGSYEYKELQALWIYISDNRLTFTAVNFFQIKPSVLLGIIASATTYFIALIQFN